MKPILVILIAFVTAGCSSADSSKPINEQWDRLIITTENRSKVIIENYEDSAIVMVYHKGTIFQPIKERRIDTSKIWFQKSERDSLMLLSANLIAKPAFTDAFCTEFVGALSIEIQKGNVLRAVKYHSICDWPSLSEETRSIYRILKRRTPNVYTGNNTK